MNDPEQYKNESISQYRTRCWKWQHWLKLEPRPDLWYASEDEVIEYKKWRDSNAMDKR